MQGLLEEMIIDAAMNHTATMLLMLITHTTKILFKLIDTTIAAIICWVLTLQVEL